MMSDLRTRLLLYLAHRESNAQGLTLIELMVVIVMIGILSAISVPMFANQVNKAREAEAITFVGAFNRGQQMYYMHKSKFAPSLEDLESEILVRPDNDTYNYIVPDQPPVTGSDSTGIIAEPRAPGLRYLGGVVWIDSDDNALVSRSIVCKGELGATLNIRTCRDVNAPQASSP